MTHQVFKCLDRAGAVITYFRNFVLNTIFLVIFFIIAMTVLVSCVVGTAQDAKENKALDTRNNATIMTIDFGSEVTDNRPFATPLEKVLSELNHENDSTSSMIDLTYVLKTLANGDAPKIKTVFLDLSSLGYIRLDQTKTLGSLIDDVKKKDIKVYAYAPAFSQSVYALAAHANVIGIDPLGEVDLSGIALKSLYYKNLIDKLSLDVYTPKAGTHKSAVEPYNRNDMSPQVKEEYQGIITDLWQQFRDSITSARNTITQTDLDTSFSGGDKYLPALRAENGDVAAMALKYHLVDKVVPYSEFMQAIAKDAGVKVIYKKKQNTYKLDSAISMDEFINDKNFNPTAIPSTEHSIAIVYGLGEISSSSEKENDFTSENIIPQLNRIAENPNIGAVIMYLNTPGGEVYASEQIRRKLADLKAKGKKVIIYMSGMTASGGYWISTAADLIVANPSTITGSIGVLAITGSASRLTEDLGITADGVDNSDTALNSIFLPISDKQKEIMQLSINSVYHNFVSNVSKARDIPYDEADLIAQGRIYTGQNALRLKLVDRLGNLDTAIEAASELMKVNKGTTPEVYHSEPVVSDTMEMLNAVLAKAVARVSEPTAIKLVNGLMKDPVLKGTVNRELKNNANAKTPLVYSYTPLTVDY